MALAEVKVLSCLLFRRRRAPSERAREEAGALSLAVPSSSDVAPRPLLLLPPAVLKPRFLSPSVLSPVSFFGHGSGEQPAADSAAPRARHRPHRLLLLCYFAAIISLLFFTRANPPLRTFSRCVEGLLRREQLSDPMLCWCSVWKCVLGASSMCRYGCAETSPLQRVHVSGINRYLAIRQITGERDGRAPFVSG